MTLDDLRNSYPYTASRRKTTRHQFVLTTEQLCQLRKVHEDLGEKEINLHLWWAQLGEQLGFKWWTMKVVTAQPLTFTAELS
jgi:hypothetical protein